MPKRWRRPRVLGSNLGVEAVSLEVARKWQKDAGYREAVKSLEQSVEQLVRLGVHTQRRDRP